MANAETSLIAAADSKILRFPGNIPEKLMDWCPWIHFKAYQWKFNICNEKRDNPTAGRERIQKINEVALYMPGQFAEMSTATWGEENPLDSAMIATAAKGAAEWLTGKNTVSSAKASLGQIIQPTEILLFQKPEHPTFTVAVDMMPRNKDEAEMAGKICTLFKTFILPSRTPDIGNIQSIEVNKVIKNPAGGGTEKAFLNFPPVWDVTFANINVVGLHLESSQQENSYENCALTSVTVTYGGAEQSVMTFYDDMPVKMSLNLQFKMIRSAIRV